MTACGAPSESEISVSAAASDGLTVGGYSCPQSGNNTVSTIPANNQYYLTTFTGGTMACGGQANGVSLYVADRQRFGCGASLRVTNTKNGQSCVATVSDLGPNICVEEAAGMPIIDASPAIAEALFGTSSAGWSDGFLVEAVVTTDPVGCGTVPAGGGGSSSSSSGSKGGGTGTAGTTAASSTSSSSSGGTSGSGQAGGSSSSSGSASSSSGGSSSAGGGLCFVTSLGQLGECMSTAACAALPNSVSTPGYCPGAANVECCTSTGTSSGSSSGGSSSSSSGGGGSSSGDSGCSVDGVAGQCMLTTDCAGLTGYVSTPGYCPGADDIQCCTPQGSSGGSSSSSSGSGTVSAGSSGQINGGGPGDVCAVGTTLQGADLSDYQGTVDWAQVAGAGLSFSIAKATEGITLQDTQFAANWSGMQQNGIVRGAYHFFHSLDDGTSQADAFLAAVSAAGGFQTGDMPPFLDWEATDSGDTSQNAINQAQAFIDEIQAKTGMTTIIYTDPGFWEGLGDTSQFAGYPLWLANIQVTCPDVPSPWTGWVIWQYDWYGTIPGMNCPGACDMDEFDGTLADLQAL